MRDASIDRSNHVRPATPGSPTSARRAGDLAARARRGARRAGPVRALADANAADGRRLVSARVAWALNDLRTTIATPQAAPRSPALREIFQPAGAEAGVGAPRTARTSMASDVTITLRRAQREED